MPCVWSSLFKAALQHAYLAMAYASATTPQHTRIMRRCVRRAVRRQLDHACVFICHRASYRGCFPPSPHDVPHTVCGRPSPRAPIATWPTYHTSAHHVRGIRTLCGARRLSHVRKVRPTGSHKHHVPHAVRGCGVRQACGGGQIATASVEPSWLRVVPHLRMQLRRAPVDFWRRGACMPTACRSRGYDAMRNNCSHWSVLTRARCTQVRARPCAWLHRARGPSSDEAMECAVAAMNRSRMGVQVPWLPLLPHKKKKKKKKKVLCVDTLSLKKN
eukprot:NODE_11410_length_1288_cov_8.754522.p1 GENE.NODE_11410_length_1288_cov_8.754522~~NODE_11410_length_1288_cov_8.754522.p1  ORF type:complete len:273 (-),score=26.67 NODE_11410_length_1288_cov_8.754522:72-890(-)